MVTVQQKIRALRKANRLSAEAVAKQVGISRPFYTQLEGGKRRLSVMHLAQIARALGVSAADLLRDDLPYGQEQGIAGSSRKHHKYLRPINTPELKRKLEPLLGEDTEDFLDCYQLWITAPQRLKRQVLEILGAKQ